MDPQVNEEFTMALETKDPRVANLYRHALYFLKVYAISSVTFTECSCCRQEEVIAQTLGQIPLKYSAVDPNRLEFPFEVEGPRYFTTDDIPGLPTSFKIPIFKLGSGETIKGTVRLSLGRAADHARWKAFSTAAMKQGENEKYSLQIGTVGVLSPAEILARIEEGIPEARLQKSLYTFFTFSNPR